MAIYNHIGKVITEIFLWSANLFEMALTYVISTIGIIPIESIIWEIRIK
jgi:hypothetical protein